MDLISSSLHIEIIFFIWMMGLDIRFDTLVYRGGSLRVTEWNKDGVKLLMDGLTQGSRLLLSAWRGQFLV